MTPPFDDAGTSERRGRMPSIPEDYRSMLNVEQQNALRNVENFGWEVAFVRRPMFQVPTVVVSSPDHQHYAVLEPDGEVNMHPEIVIRH